MALAFAQLRCSRAFRGQGRSQALHARPARRLLQGKCYIRHAARAGIPSHPEEDRAMSFASDFKAFIMRGNVLDLAIAVVIGGAFGKVVTSLVNDVIMPPIGLLIGGIDFSKLKWIIKNSPDPKQVVSINYGAFVNTVITFLIIALAVFLMIWLVKHVMPKKEAVPPPPVTPPDVVLLAEIRDLLKQRPA
jgi:large conductance mechanosensitive channel